MRKSLVLIMVVIFISVASGCQRNISIENTYTMLPHSNWPDQHRKVALKSYLYAQMANNTYGQKGDSYISTESDFILPSDWTVNHFGNNELGYAYSIYQLIKNNEPKEMVIAFRGTEGLTNFKDVIYGNLLAKQNKLAIKTYLENRDRLDKSGYKHVPIILVGHSLGGALAVHTAINVDGNVPYYVFNSSPRFNKLKGSKPDDFDKVKENRNSIVETSEFLYALRFAAKEANQTYTPFNCDSKFKPFTSHGIEKLAKCLTMVASLNDPAAEVKMVSKFK